MELVSSNSETIPRKAIFKYRFKRNIFKTKQITIKFSFNHSIIFSIIIINFISFQIVFNKLEIPDFIFYPNSKLNSYIIQQTAILNFESILLNKNKTFHIQDQFTIQIKYLNPFKYSELNAKNPGRYIPPP